MRKRPTLVVDHKNLRHNMNTVIGWCREAGIDVAGVSKVTTGLASAALDDESCGAKWIASSRLEQLARAREAGVDVILETQPKMFHSYVLYTNYMPESKSSYRLLKDFIKNSFSL